MRAVIGPSLSLLLLGLAGCLGDGGAINVRWRIAERETGRVLDPRDVVDGSGACVQTCDGGAADCGERGRWRIDRVRVELTDPETGGEIAEPPAGLDAPCGEREFTTPFTLPEGLFGIQLSAYDPATGELQAESPIPELRVVTDAEIVNLDVVELSVSVP